MKTIIVILALFTQTAFAKVLICKQKLLPVKTEYTLSADQAVVKLTAEKDLEDFEIVDVHGIDGLEVISKNEVAIQDLSKGQSITLTVKFTKPSGQSFLVTDIRAKTNAKTKAQSLPIPVGNETAEQVQAKKKNIKSLPGFRNNKPGTSALESETKYHTMKLPE